MHEYVNYEILQYCERASSHYKLADADFQRSVILQAVYEIATIVVPQNDESQVIRMKIYANLAENDEIQMMMLDDDQFLDSTIDCLQLDYDQFKEMIDPCLKIIGSLLSIEAGVKVAEKLSPKLFHLFALTAGGDPSIENHVCWLLSNYVVCGE